MTALRPFAVGALLGVAATAGTVWALPIDDGAGVEAPAVTTTTPTVDVHCVNGMQVFTTSNGGIAVFPGGTAC